MCKIKDYITNRISGNPWKRRQSVVGLIEYFSKRKKVLPFVHLIRVVEPLLDDPEYYFQKGIGWTLREIYNAYPDKTLCYIKKYLLSISPIAYSAATEKIDKRIKQNFNKERKRNRNYKKSIKKFSLPDTDQTS
ncbi:DNA alkylation repair protein [bacterium]|nr:DNA alkylation repair protein [bacterium]